MFFVTASRGGWSESLATGAKTSPDGGAMWAKLGRKDIGLVSDIWVSTPRTCTLRAIRGCGASSII